MNSLHSFPGSRQSQHRYACQRCRIRKVKCDKIIPTCIYCVEVGAQCVYLARRPRNSQKLQQDSVTRRPLPLLRAEETAGGNACLKHGPGSHGEVQSDFEDDEDIVLPREMHDPLFEARSDPSHEGRLFVAQGKSRYINSDKAKQVANLQSILAAESIENEDEAASTPRPSAGLDGSSLFGTSRARICLRTYHPSPEAMGVLWNYYVRNVDVLVKIIYKPAVETLIENASVGVDEKSAAVEALLFGIWFSTVTAMSTDECLALLKTDRSALLVRYRYALEQALGQAGWMTSQEVLVLQALTLYIGFNPRKDSRSLWMLSGIALGVAQAMGLHSDSASFRLDNIETEVRRRVWWSLVQLDVRISDDCGLEPHVPLFMDTKLPLHVNDSELNPTAESIDCRAEFTEMTPSSVKIEWAQTNLKVKRWQYGTSPMDIDEIENMAQNQIRRYENSYLMYLKHDSYLNRLCHLGVRIIIAKLWKIKFDASQRRNKFQEGDNNEGLIYYNADVLEITHQFPERTGQYGWFFHCKHTQWHAMAYLLIELCKGIHGFAANRAWAVLDVVFGELDKDAVAQGKKSVLWKPMLKLYIRACHVRKQDAASANHQTGDTHSALDSGYDTTTTTPVEALVQSTPNDENMSGDPFFGSGIDFSEKMSWDQLDTWLQSFEPDLLNDTSTDFQTNDVSGPFTWL